MFILNIFSLEIRKLEKEENKLDNLIESLQVRHQKLLKTKNNDLKLDFNKDLDEYFMKKNFILVYEIPEKSELKLNVPVNQVYYEQLNKQLKTVEGSLSFQSIKFKLEQIPNLSVCIQIAFFSFNLFFKSNFIFIRIKEIINFCQK